MPSKAQITLVGHLGSDPETRYTPEGLAIVSVNVPVNDAKKNKDGTWDDHSSWYKVTLFGKQGETFAERAQKGNLVMVTGTLATSIWNPGDGREPRVNLDVRGQEALILERKEAEDRGLHLAPRNGKQASLLQDPLLDDKEGDLPF